MKEKKLASRGNIRRLFDPFPDGPTSSRGGIVALGERRVWRPKPSTQDKKPMKGSVVRKAKGRGHVQGDLVQRSSVKRVLVIDVGGNSVKILATGQTASRSFKSGPTLGPRKMVSRVKKLARDWVYEVVSIGYPGPVHAGRIIAEPRNLGRGWIGFDFERSFGCPVKVVNDAAMQALGSYAGGKMLFLGLGTGFGTAMIVEGIIAPMELSHLPYKKKTYEYYVGRAGLERVGKKKWNRHVADVVQRLIAALQPDETVIGGGNVTKLEVIPPRCRPGANANAFKGGFRLWADDNLVRRTVRLARTRSREGFKGAEETAPTH